MAEPTIPTGIEYVAPAKNQTAAKKMFNKFWKLVPDNDCDVILISSHGRYDFSPSKEPQESTYSYEVPANTFIIETLDVGRLCTTTIDKPLWNLLQPINKTKFIELLKTTKVLHSESDELKDIVNFSNRVIEPEEYIAVLQNFIIYLPGMIVPKRTLLFGSDIFYEDVPVAAAAKGKGKKPQTAKEMHYKLTYRGFGVYRFPKADEESDEESDEAAASAAAVEPIAGAPFPKAANVVKNQNPNLPLTNIKSYFDTSNLFDKLLKTKSQTNEIVVNKIVTDASPRILIFSSCGEYGDSSNEKTRTTAMRAIQLQREAIYNSYDAGYKQFLFRKPLRCDYLPELFLDFMLEKGNDSAPAVVNPENARLLTEVGLPLNWVTKNKFNRNAAAGQVYRTIYFPQRENYESKYMFDPQDFEINLFKNMMTPLELSALNDKLNEQKRAAAIEAEHEFIDENRQLYVDFLNHRAEVWFENMHMFLADSETGYTGVFNAAYISSLNAKIQQSEQEMRSMAKNSPEQKAKAKIIQDLKDTQETMVLYIQMICWTTHLSKKIKEGEEASLEGTFSRFLANAIAERKAKANAKAAAGIKGGTRRKTRKNLKRGRQSKRHYRGHN